MTGKPRGGDGNGDGGTVPRQRGRADEVPASVSEGQSQVAEAAGYGRGSSGKRPPGARTGTSGGSGGPPFKVVDGVPGPAQGKTLNLPNARHTVSGSRSGQIKGDTSVYLRGYEGVAREDVAQIAAGNAEWVKETQCYNINGRSYRLHPETGTVFPVSGDGVVKLDRNEYAALKEIAKAEGDLAKATQLTREPRFFNNPDVVAKAKQIYDGTYEP